MRRFFGCLMMLGVLAGCDAKMSSDTSSTISTPAAAEEEVVAISETVDESPAADAAADTADPQVTPAVFNVGDAAPKFANLAGVDDKKYGLDDFSEAKAVAVVFTCNNCPVAKAYEDRLNEYQKEYKDKGVQLVAINVNNVDGDRMPEMKTRTTEKGFEFPYLYDPTQKVARDFHAEVTPHVFLLDKDRKLAYVGPVDDNMDDASAAKPLLRQATDAALAGKAPEVTQEKPLGCGSSMSDCRTNCVAAIGLGLAVSLATAGCDSKTGAKPQAALAPVSLVATDAEGLRAAIEAHRGQVVLVDFWATWCLPCVEQFPHTVELSRQLGERGLAVMSVSMDSLKSEARVREFLEKQDARFENFLGNYETALAATKAFELPGPVPCYRVYDREGKLHREFGVDPSAAKQFTAEDVEAAVKELL